MNDIQKQIDILEQEIVDRLLTAQLSTSYVIRQAQEKMAEQYGQLLDELKNTQVPLGGGLSQTGVTS